MTAMRDDIRRMVEEYSPRIQAIGSGGFVTPSTFPKSAAGKFLQVNPSPPGLITPALGLFIPQAIALSEGMSIDQTIIEVTTGGASNTFRVGFYADNGFGRPGTLLLDAGTVATATTGFKIVTTVFTLPAGVTWVVAVSQAGTPAAVRSVTGSQYAIPLETAVNAVFPAGTGVTGALPGTAPALTSTAQAGAPRILFRKA